MSCEALNSSPALSEVEWLGVHTLRYKIASHLSDQKVVWSQDVVAVRVVTHTC